MPCFIATICTTPLAVHEYDKGLYPLHIHWVETDQVRVVCESQYVVCRWAPECYSRLPRRSSYHIQETVKLCLHPVRLWKRGSAKDFNGPILYWSGWYILEYHDNVFLYQSPPKALIGQETQNTWQPLSTVRTYAFVWPCSAACARGRRILVSASEWLHNLKSGTQEEFSIHIILGYLYADEWKQLLFVLLIFKEATVPFMLRDFSAAIADPCLWPIPTSLLCESFNVIFVRMIIQ